MAKFQDLKGMIFGKLEVLKRVDDQIQPSGYKTIMWLCECSCENHTRKIVSSKNLKSKSTVSCGCYAKSVKKDLSGQTFGRLMVLSRAPNYISPSGITKIMYHCICDCENQTQLEVAYESLTTSNTSSCGCIHSEQLIERNTTHGKSDTLLYDVWRGMKSRCYNENNQDYNHYGGRGIIICDEWKNDFQVFYDWAILNQYSQGLSIDRRNFNGNYEPNNCRWTTQLVQMNNTRMNRYFEIDNITKTVSEWARDFKINPNTVYNRLKTGLNIVEALTKPINGGQYNG